MPHSLMGYGNHTYGEDQRGEGAGTVLSPASAMALAHQPLFTGVPLEPDPDGRCDVQDLAFDWADGKLTVSGRVEAVSTVYGVVAYHDPDEPASDYDAVGWTAAVPPTGRFAVSLAQLRPGKAQLRLRFCHVNGTATKLPFSYGVDAQGVPDVARLWASSLQSRAVRAWQAGDRAAFRAARAAALERCPDDAELAYRLQLLERLLGPRAPMAPATVPAATKEVAVSDLAFAEERVGWGRPLRDQVLLEGPDAFLSLGGKVYDKGLFAHAPSLYRLSLGGGWTQLRAGYGLNDGHPGSVVFVVRGDGRELFRSDLIRDHPRRGLVVDVAGVNDLELVAEDGGDGPNNDWGIWVEPVLRR
ncbi:MAG: NPCBM/NEW2 domain-containing protein [Armatimonadetes bacterium]|nr:NPCBM/NEW2 domain-containing protein [Armatimonadota bacterium]